MKKKHTNDPTKFNTVFKFIYGPRKQNNIAADINTKLKFLRCYFVTYGKKYNNNLDLPTSIKQGYTVLNPYK